MRGFFPVSLDMLMIFLSSALNYAYKVLKIIESVFMIIS